MYVVARLPMRLCAAIVHIGMQTFSLEIFHQTKKPVSSLPVERWHTPYSSTSLGACKGMEKGAGGMVYRPMDVFTSHNALRSCRQTNVNYFHY